MARIANPSSDHNVHTRRRIAPSVIHVGNDIGSWITVDTLEFVVHILAKSSGCYVVVIARELSTVVPAHAYLSNLLQFDLFPSVRLEVCIKAWENSQYLAILRRKEGTRF